MKTYSHDSYVKQIENLGAVGIIYFDVRPQQGLLFG